MSRYKKVNKEINCSHVANRTYIADSRYFHASWNPNLQFNQNKNNNLKIRTSTEKLLFYIMTINGKNMSSAYFYIFLKVLLPSLIQWVERPFLMILSFWRNRSCYLKPIYHNCSVVDVLIFIVLTSLDINVIA